MSKNLVAEFHSLVSPFSDTEVQRAIKALFESALCENLEDCPCFLKGMVFKALNYGIYEKLVKVNLMQLILDELKEDDFLEKVALELDKVCKVGYLGYKMEYADEGQNDFLFYFDKVWYETLTKDYKESLKDLPLWVHFFFKNAKLVDFDTYFKE